MYVICGSTHVATFQLAVTHHSNATSLFPILLSLQTSVSAHNSRNKRRFPSQNLSQHICANSHAYKFCQQANGRTDEQRENHIKRPWFQPEESFIQHRHPAEDTSTRIFKQASRKPAAISRRASTFPTHQDGQPVRVRSNVV